MSNNSDVKLVNSDVNSGEDNDEQLHAEIRYASEGDAEEINRQIKKRRKRKEDMEIIDEFESDEEHSPLAPSSNIPMREIRTQAQLEAIMKGQRKMFKELKYTKKKLRDSMKEMRDYVSSSYYSVVANNNSDNELPSSSSDSESGYSAKKVYKQVKKKHAKRKNYTQSEPELKISNKLKFK